MMWILGLHKEVKKITNFLIYLNYVFNNKKKSFQKNNILQKSIANANSGGCRALLSSEFVQTHQQRHTRRKISSLADLSHSKEVPLFALPFWSFVAPLSGWLAGGPCYYYYFLRPLAANPIIQILRLMNLTRRDKTQMTR